MISINRLSDKSFLLQLSLTVLLTGLLLTPVAHAEPGIDTRPSNTSCVAPERPDTGEVILQEVFGNLSMRGLMTIEYPTEDASHLFGLDRASRVHRFPNDPDTTETSIALSLRPLFEGTQLSGILRYKGIELRPVQKERKERRARNHQRLRNPRVHEEDKHTWRRPRRRTLQQIPSLSPHQEYTQKRTRQVRWIEILYPEQHPRQDAKARPDEEPAPRR